jgi:glycosyltransferase involved in cell wall biosynthesis
MIAPQFRPLVGGYEQAADRLSAALAAAGLHVVVVTERRERSWASSETFDGYAVRRLFCWYRPKLHVITSLASFAAFLLRHGREFDVWHVHQYGLHAGLAIALGQPMRRPVVLKLTNSGSMGIAATLGGGVIGRILGFLHRRVSACVALTEQTRMEAIGFGVPVERVRVIPNGVDGRRFKPTSPDERASARRALALECRSLVLSVGRLSPEKNLLGLVDAWTGMDADVRDGAMLALVGDGPSAAEISARVHASSASGSILLAGHRSDVANWYRAADLFVISSNNEGLSNSMIEALASGLPVVSTSVSGSSVLLDCHAGLVVDVGDVEGLARAIGELLADPSRRKQLGENARDAFESRFSLETVSGATIELYNRVLDRSSSAAGEVEPRQG